MRALLRRVGRVLGRIAVVWLPILAVFLGVGFVVEVTHARTTYSQRFSAPTNDGQSSGATGYSAVPDGQGWQLFSPDLHGNLVLRRIGSTGRTLWQRVVGQSASNLSWPAMAWGAGSDLGAWVNNPGGSTQTLEIAAVTPNHVYRRALTTSGFAEHPFVVANPRRHQFDVFFGWQPAKSNFDIYAARLSSTGRLLGRLVRLSNAVIYDYYPRATWNGHQLTLLYLNQCCRSNYLHVVYQRLSWTLRPLGAPRFLDLLATSSAAPDEWGLDVRTGPGGSVWATWINSSALKLARWSAAGKLSFVRTILVANGFDQSNLAVSLGLNHNEGWLYYATGGAVGFYLASTRFNRQGFPVASYRVSYGTLGSDMNPVTGVSAGRSRVIWEEGTGGSAVFQSSTDRGHVAASGIQNLGLGLGSPLVDLTILLIGSLLAGAVLTMINGFILLPLLFAWLPIGKLLPDRFNWIVYGGVVAAVLSLLFATRTFASNWMLLVRPLSQPSSALAVGGAVFVGYWVNRVGMREQEPVFRAAALALTAFYFIAAMWAIGGIENRLTLI